MPVKRQCDTERQMYVELFNVRLTLLAPIGDIFGVSLKARSHCTLNVHTAHSMRIQSGVMRIGLRSHCQGVNAH